MRGDCVGDNHNREMDEWRAEMDAQDKYETARAANKWPPYYLPESDEPLAGAPLSKKENYKILKRIDEAFKASPRYDSLDDLKSARATSKYLRDLSVEPDEPLTGAPLSKKENNEVIKRIDEAFAASPKYDSLDDLKAARAASKYPPYHLPEPDKPLQNLRNRVVCDKDLYPLSPNTSAVNWPPKYSPESDKPLKSFQDPQPPLGYAGPWPPFTGISDTYFTTPQLNPASYTPYLYSPSSVDDTDHKVLWTDYPNGMSALNVPQFSVVPPETSLTKSKNPLYSGPHLVSFVGPIGAGKSTAAKILVERYDFIKMSFADPLKDMLAAIGLSYEQLYGSEKNVPLDLLCGKTTRHAMQTLGTTFGRECIGWDFWVGLWKTKVKSLLDAGHLVVVDDCRFANEDDAVRELGGAHVRVGRTSEDLNEKKPTLGTKILRLFGRGTHVSEAYWVKEHCGILNRASVDSLKENIVRVLHGFTDDIETYENC